MKFQCPKCRKQFALSSKLAGKSLRVRCTSCGSVFKMRVAAPAQKSAADALRERVSAPAAQAPAPAQPVAPAPAPRSEAPAASAVLTPPPQAAAPPPPPPPPPEPPPPPPLPSPHKYFAVIGGKRLGPMPLAALKRLIDEKKIGQDTLLWHKGMSEWKGAGVIGEVAGMFAAPPAPPPLPVQGTAPPPLRRPPPPAPAPAQRPVTPAKQPQVDEELTDEELGLDEVDNDFFARGVDELATAQPAPELKGLDSIDISDGPVFPIEMEQQTVEKGAAASLRDFSVMVRLSQSSRRKNVLILGLFGIVAASTLASIFIFGDPLAAIFPEKQMIDQDLEAHKFYEGAQQAKKKAKEAKKEPAKIAAQEEEVINLDEDPEDLLKSMKDKEWRVTVEEDDLDIDRSQLASKLKDPVKRNDKKHGSNTKSADRKRDVKYHKPEVDDDPDEMSLAEFANSVGEKDDGPGSLIAKTGGGPNKVADKMDSAMGNLFGGPRHMEERKVTAKVKEREGDGVALKALVARHVGKKVGGERKAIARCVDQFGSSYSGVGGKLKATLHFTEKGTVHKVSIKGASQKLEQCFLKVFIGWRIATINRKIKIPIAIRFE